MLGIFRKRILFVYCQEDLRIDAFWAVDIISTRKL